MCVCQMCNICVHTNNLFIKCFPEIFSRNTGRRVLLIQGVVVGIGVYTHYIYVKPLAYWLIQIQ